MQFAVSKSGLVVVPLLSGVIASGLTRLAMLSPDLAGRVDPDAVAGWVWGVVLAFILQSVNKVQGDGVVKIQGALDMTPVVDAVTQDRYAGPKLYAEVRRAIAVAENAPQKPRD
jgi:hypothetical protein